MTTPDKAPKAADTVTAPVTFECTVYPQLCVWRSDAEPMNFAEAVGSDGYEVLRDNKHGDPYRVGYFTTSDPAEIAYLDAFDPAYDICRSAV